ncbi:hypothetical protein chiPu_0024536 [Chiloscyllium punctatum]|uniref:Uncharacterized protein n=1 Tax=Chiloscyllium punctatum TaxID=137246 RepID=A0A401TD92_CHIPU|nr:hypothetical protein [Chiloscyllium punctatum]
MKFRMSLPGPPRTRADVAAEALAVHVLVSRRPLAQLLSPINSSSSLTSVSLCDCTKPPGLTSNSPVRESPAAPLEPTAQIKITASSACPAHAIAPLAPNSGLRLTAQPPCY